MTAPITLTDHGQCKLGREAEALRAALKLAEETLTAISMCYTADKPEVSHCMYCDEFMEDAVWPAHGNPDCVVGKTLAAIIAALEGR